MKATREEAFAHAYAGRVGVEITRKAIAREIRKARNDLIVVRAMKFFLGIA